MNAPLREMEREYLAALDAYLQAEDETALSRAYELGRRAIVAGLGVLDMALLHRAAVAKLVLPAPPSDAHRLVDVAAEVFNELLAPFEMSFRGYRDANDELQRLNQTLLQQKQAVETTNRELESFSYSVSHDLRSPLRSIDGFSALLLEDFDPMLDDRGRKYLRNVREAAQHMGQLIDDLLALSRVKLGEIHRIDVDLSALAGRIAERLRGSAPGRSARFAIQSGVHANGDANLLAVLFENLLGNAWKFTSKRAHAEIAFACESRDGVPTYSIRDNGAGFSMAHASRLFAAFQRLHPVSEFEGTGIGLAIVQRVVLRHEGRVWAEAQVDHGATFYFTLSRKPFEQ